MKTKGGFILIEVILSLALIAIFVGTICSITLSAARIKAISEKKDDAFNIARGICEMFKSETGEFLDADYRTLYKPIDNLSEIDSIEDIMKNGIESYNSLNLAVEKNRKYVLMLNLSKKTGTGITKGNTPDIDILKVKVYIIGRDIVTMTEAR